ncbi:CPBP family intramembrane glutamic endopeptidase [Kutzneria sp. CA-103260]|uniref:CPBP family intramembrane glutamic endopeptidase n=1 Tax=Kutzneria sp. CA-103260 TaxID=2802641 RepID=UPI001BADC1DB|nr:type II CAAX endopeptidase family protein [Kutzneria sp. CA-103260]QUQ71496.1 integral membrane protein [Kutzneria sp. CA-103260]
MDEQRQQHPPTDLAWGLTAFLLGFGLYYLVSLVIVGFLPAPSGPRSGARLVVPLVANLFLGLVPWWFSRRRGRGVLADFGFLPTRRDVLVGLVCGVASVVVGLIIAMVVAQVIPPQASPITSHVDAWLIGYVAFLVIGAPVTEELLVRGALWGALERYQVPRLTILALTALIFAFLHLDPSRLASLFAQGVAIGAARLVTGRIGASMVAHATNNLLPGIVTLAAT